MKNLKEKRLQLIQELQDTNPEFAAGRKLTFSLLAAIVISRVVHIVLQLIYFLMYGISIHVMINVVAMVMMIGVALLFAFFIYSAGIKGCAYLALFGGLLSLMKAYQSGTFEFLFNLPETFQYNPYFWIMSLVFLLVIVLQIGVMAVLSLHPTCNVYFKEMAQVQKTMKTLIQEQRPS